MAEFLQLEFFEKSEIETCLDKVKQIKESSDKVRKSLFAKHNELSKMYIELDNRLKIIERHICDLK